MRIEQLLRKVHQKGFEAEGESLIYVVTLYLLALGMDAKLIYEVGVERGRSTLAFLMACLETGGRLYSCDIRDCEGVISDPSLRAQWGFCQQLSEDFFAGRTEQADLIYLDGEHSVTWVRREAEQAWPLLRAGGLLVLHDTLYMPDGPGQVFRELRDRHAEAIELPWAHGFGLVRKIS